MSDNITKVMPLAAAIERYVADGAHISLGGFTLNRNPMAAVYEIIRQKKKNFHLYAHSNGMAVDELIGAGCIAKLEIAYGGIGKAAPTCVRFRKAIQENRILFEDYSNYMMGLRFLAGAMGVPFLPTLSGLGSQIVSTGGFSEELRRDDPKIVNQKLKVMDNPFEGWTGADKVLLLPAINPDVTILHVQKADTMGTCRIEGLTFADIEQARASHRVIVTCEEMVTPAVLREDPDRNQIPFIHVTAVCHVPWGGYPTAVFRHYDYDARYLRDFAAAAKNESDFEAYQAQYIFGVKHHRQLLDRVGSQRLQAITADKRTGYATGMKRD